jgi:hypothetical protein
VCVVVGSLAATSLANFTQRTKLLSQFLLGFGGFLEAVFRHALFRLWLLGMLFQFCLF